MSGESKISPYNLAGRSDREPLAALADPWTDCKNTTDDTLCNYLNSLKIKQSNFYTDVRLALGYAAVIVCAITFAYDYKLGFEKTKHWTLGTVIVYFLLNGAFTYWLWLVEKNIIYTGDYKGRKVGDPRSSRCIR